MSLVVEKPGMLSTVQDLGRPHLRSAGLPPGGAMDAVALRTANLLVENAEDAAVIECALVGPVLRFRHRTDIAVAGARVAGLPFCERFRVAAGRTIDLSTFVAGAYAYVAVAGGIDVPAVLGSRSTDVRLAFGGHAGRPLRAGDVLHWHRQPLSVAGGPLRVSAIGDHEADRPIRIIDGRDAGRIDGDWIHAAYTVSSKSDRVGVRLAGPAIACTQRPDAASCVVLPGTIQLPADGTPIVLLADAQTLGGYPQIGHVAGVDLHRIAQIRPGKTVRFERISLAEAHRLARRRDRELAMLRYGIRHATEGHAHD